MADHTSKPTNFISNTFVDLREFFTRWIEGNEHFYEERDRRYEARFKALEEKFEDALVAQEKSVTASFVASEKAIIKAEGAQQDYNARSNEFRGQLDDQAKTLMSKEYGEAKFNSTDNKIEEIKKVYDVRLDAMRLTYDGKIDDLKKEIQSLRESRSAGEGAGGAHQQDRTQANWSTGVMLTIIFFAAGTIIGVVEFILRATGH